MATIECIKKGGRLVAYVATGNGPVERTCDRACCKDLPKHERYILLPCGCHSTFVKCTCPLKEAACGKCGRCFITTKELKGKEWFEIEDPHEVIDTQPYGAELTPAVRRRLAKMDTEEQREWMADLKTLGPWWLWELKSQSPSKKRAHIARKWSHDGRLIGTCCSLQYLHSDMAEVDPNYPDVIICGHCQRNAAKNGIEIGNRQPRLR